MSKLWNSKVAQFLLAFVVLVMGVLMSVNAKDPDFWNAHKHWLVIALALATDLHVLLTKKPTTVGEAVKDVLDTKKAPPVAGPPPAAIVVLGLIVLAAYACALTPTPAPGTPTAPSTTFKYCTTDALKAAGANLLGDVANAVATDDYVAELEKLVAQFGAAEVKCAVELFVNSTFRKASADKLAATEVSRAQDWLSTQ